MILYNLVKDFTDWVIFTHLAFKNKMFNFNALGLIADLSLFL